MADPKRGELSGRRGLRAPGFPASLSLNDADCEALCRLIRESTGLAFGPDRRWLLESKLSPMVAHAGFDSFTPWVVWLRSGLPAARNELEGVLDALLNHETRFFRDAPLLQAFVVDILGPLAVRRAQQGARVLRVWSAGCASGEEPYTIAMLISDHFAGQPGGLPVRIAATDLSKRVLRTARAAVYPSRALRSVPEQSCERHFEPAGDDAHRVRQSIRSTVTFERQNLFQAADTMKMRGFDAVLCRNTLIYFDPRDRETVVRGFHRALNPGGVLLLGQAETLAGLHVPFEAEACGAGRVWRSV